MGVCIGGNPQPHRQKDYTIKQSSASIRREIQQQLQTNHQTQIENSKRIDVKQSDTTIDSHNTLLQSKVNIEVKSPTRLQLKKATLVNNSKTNTQFSKEKTDSTVRSRERHKSKFNNDLESQSSDLKEIQEISKADESAQSQPFRAATISDQKKINSSQDQPTRILIDHLITLANGNKYRGQWKNGLPQGKGVMNYSNGNTYQGEWCQGQYLGKGELLYSNGNLIQGEWQNNQIIGNATIVFGSGAIYKGQISNLLPSGLGVKTWSNQDKYQGQWVDGKQCGHGALFFADGSYYKGNFLDNMIHGRGQYFWKEQGKTYCGQWVQNRKQGLGCMQWANGQKYQGQFRADKMDGEGEFLDKNGNMYIGRWQNGLRQGQFRLFSKKGYEERQQWSFGNLLTKKKRSRKKPIFLQKNSDGTEE